MYQPIFKRLSILFAATLFLLLPGAQAQQKPIVEFFIGVENANPGDTVCLPISTQNFKDVIGAGFGLRWPTDKLEFVKVNLDFSLAGLNESSFGLTNVVNGEIRFSWITENFPTAVSLNDNATLFEVCFVLTDTLGGSFSSLSFDNDFITPEVILDDAIYENPLARTNFTPGGIFINALDHNLSLSPEFSFELTCSGLISRVDPLVMGGVPPYSYNWSGPDIFFFNGANLGALKKEGNYTLEVQDQAGNQVNAVFRIDFMGNENGLAIPVINTNIIEPVCGSSLGAFSLEVEGGNEGYDFIWSTGATGATLDQLPSGEYAVTVSKQGNSCTDILSLELMGQGEIATGVFSNDLNCEGGMATIGLDLIEGVNYIWNNGQRTPTIDVTEAGQYFVVLEDSFCTQTVNFTVNSLNNSPDPEDFAFLNAELSCEDTLGTIGVLYNGSQTGLSYSWDNGAQDSVISVDRRGTFFLTVTGEDGCSAVFDFNVDQREDAFDLVPFEEMVSCNQSQIGVRPFNPTLFDFMWNTGDSTPLITVDIGNQYILTISKKGTDCSENLVFTLPGGERTNARLVSVQCNVVDNCYLGTTVNVRVDRAVEPITYIWSTGDTVIGGDAISLNIFSRQALDLYIQDADGCVKDTIRNILPNCVSQSGVQELNLRQYVVCRENAATQKTDAYIFNELLGNLTVPPYAYEWSDGFRDTSYFRTGRLLEDIPSLAFTVSDLLGNSFTRNLTIPIENYSCGDENTASFLAPHVVVEPGESFVYPIYVKNHEGLKRAVYTIDWDPCLLDADSIVFYLSDGSTAGVGEVFPGTYETGFFADAGGTTNDSTLVSEIYFRARPDAGGVSPFLFSINEAAQNVDGSIALLRPQHGSITVGNSSLLVAPGDADKSGTVDNKDVLNIGLAFRNSGPDRRLQEVFEKEFGYSWFQQTPLSGIDFKNIDCNGDGMIDATDLEAIYLNWNPVLKAGRSALEEGDIPLYLDADTLLAGRQEQFPIVLGDEMSPADNVYGLAFSIEYDPSKIDPNSFSLDLDGGWLTANSTPLSLLRNDEENNILYLAISRTNGNNASGFGAIAQLRFQTLSGVNGTASFQVKDVKMINAQEEEVLTFNRETIATVTLSTGVYNAALQSKIQLYPNPVRNRLYIQSEGVELQEYTIFGLDGRIIKQGPFFSNILDLEQLQTGIYWIRIVTDQGLISKKLMK